MQGNDPKLQALRDFARDLTAKTNQPAGGEPEDQLRGPFENLLHALGRDSGREVVCVGEAALPDRLGRPDYAVQVAGALVGYAELKAPGKGADPARYSGHDREQWQRFQALPNILYTDGSDWSLYRDGECISRVRFDGDASLEGPRAVTARDAERLYDLLADFFSWVPIIPEELPAFAAMLAPLCGLLRRNVTDALGDARSPLHHLARDWRQLLFPDADDEQFADAYAQTVTFALLLARSEGADPLTLDTARRTLADDHSLLSRAVQLLTDDNARAEISAPLDILVRVIGEVPTGAFAGGQDPWLYFYEDFLAVYDPVLRRNAGAYYTPVQMVRAQVRLVDDLLTNRLGRTRGFADPGVVTLDPAVGTGTYLLGVVEHVLRKARDRQGPGAVAGQATALARNLYGFELLVGPFAVAQLRVSRALESNGAELPEGGPHVYLTDTLESPHAEPPQLPLFLAPIAEQHARALEVKAGVPVIVCIGNPPYDRHEAASADNRARTGGWVRWADDEEGTGAILDDFTEPAKEAGHGGHLKNLYNLYVYFWRWALWKVFESATAAGPGVVSFITASSYLDGDAFCGMREHMRRQCDEIWILDLGGEGRGTRRDDNVFDIQTPVAVAVAVRHGEPDHSAPARVRYTRIEGTREEKFVALDAVEDFASADWQDCPDNWHASFRPAGTGPYFDWPLMTDVMPWQQSGLKAGRTWVIGPSAGTLELRWRALCQATGERRRELFKDSPSGMKTHDTPNDSRAIIQLPRDAPCPARHGCAYRSFDRQFIMADRRLVDRPGPPLWAAHGERQVYTTSLLNHPLGSGPALTASGQIPDLHHFRGSYGAKEVFPLYRDADGNAPNILPGLLAQLAATWDRPVQPEDFLAYVYSVLAHPAFTDRFADELGTRELRVPLTADGDLYERARELGARLLWLHTYGERYVPDGETPGEVPQGTARCTVAVPGDEAGYPEDFRYDEDSRTLHVGAGQFGPVAPEVYEFEVSGLKVVQSWLGYRMKEPKGRRSSPLDDINMTRWPAEFTTELLELLWVLEATLAQYPAQAELLEQIVAGECIPADALPAVPDEMRKPPKRPKRGPRGQGHLKGMG